MLEDNVILQVNHLNKEVISGKQHTKIIDDLSFYILPCDSTIMIC